MQLLIYSTDYSYLMVAVSVGQVSRLLKKYLGDYVEGLSTEALRISVWNGAFHRLHLRLFCLYYLFSGYISLKALYM